MTRVNLAQLPQGFSKVLIQPGKGLLGMKSEPTELPGHRRNLMQLHQGQNHGIEDREHFHRRNTTYSTAILS